MPIGPESKKTKRLATLGFDEPVSALQEHDRFGGGSNDSPASADMGLEGLEAFETALCLREPVREPTHPELLTFQLRLEL